MELYLIRHGKTKGNLEGRYVGSTDEGILQDSIEDLKFKTLPEVDLLYVSPMKRCLETCQLLYPGMDYEIITDFKEMDFGIFEYKNYHELNGNPIYQQWIDSYCELKLMEGESKREFQRRCVGAFKTILQKARKEGKKKIAFVVHGGTIMSILDAYSYPHKDYFHWNIENGNGYLGKCEEKDEGIVIGALHRIFD